MDYVIRSCDLPKKEILMDSISNFLVSWSINFLCRKYLMDYVSRSCDLLGIDVSQNVSLDGLYNQAM